MAQFKASNLTNKIINIKLSPYDKETLLKLAKKSGFSTYSDYLRWLINQQLVRKPVR